MKTEKEAILYEGKKYSVKNGHVVIEDTGYSISLNGGSLSRDSLEQKVLGVLFDEGNVTGDLNEMPDPSFFKNPLHKKIVQVIADDKNYGGRGSLYPDEVLFTVFPDVEHSEDWTLDMHAWYGYMCCIRGDKYRNGEDATSAYFILKDAYEVEVERDVQKAESLLESLMEKIQGMQADIEQLKLRQEAEF